MELLQYFAMSLTQTINPSASAMVLQQSCAKSSTYDLFDLSMQNKMMSQLYVQYMDALSTD